MQLLHTAIVQVDDTIAQVKEKLTMNTASPLYIDAREGGLVELKA